MQTIINLSDLDYSFFEKLKENFRGKNILLSFTEIEERNSNHKEALKRMQALQKKYPPKVISKDIDLSALANEVNL